MVHLNAVSVTGKRRTRGMAILETALVLPLVILVLFGVIEYGWMFIKYQQVGAAARQGARVGITQPATNGDVTAAITTVMNNASLGSSGYTTVLSPGNVATMTSGQSLTVTVSVTYANIALTGFPLPMPTTISGKTTMAKEGVP